MSNSVQMHPRDCQGGLPGRPLNSPSSKFSPPERHELLQLAHSEPGSTMNYEIIQNSCLFQILYLAKTPSCLDRRPNRADLDPLRLQLIDEAVDVLCFTSKLQRITGGRFSSRSRIPCRLWWLCWGRLAAAAWSEAALLANI